MKLVRDDNTPWSDWIEEIAIVRQPGPYVARLLGLGIRDVLYIGTAPGNPLLAISATLRGLASDMPDGMQYGALSERRTGIGMGILNQDIGCSNTNLVHVIPIPLARTQNGSNAIHSRFLSMKTSISVRNEQKKRDKKNLVG